MKIFYLFFLFNFSINVLNNKKNLNQGRILELDENEIEEVE